MISEDGKKLEGNFSGEIQIENDGEPNISGSRSVGSDERDSDFGEIIDYGSWGSHYNYDFFVSDIGDTYELYFEAFSLGTSGFQPGTFIYEATGSNYFNNISYDDYETFSYYEAIGGSVVVTKLSGASEYWLSFDVELDDESTLSGTVEGNFDYSGSGGRMGRTKESSKSKKSGRFNVTKSTLKRITK
jgi:hypothetical protein